MPRPVHLEIHADHPARAQAFYEKVFGWSFQRWGDQPYWLAMTGADDQPGINGGLLPRQGPPPADDSPVSAFVLTMTVDDVDRAVEQVEGAGGTIALPKQATPGQGWLAYAKDTEGDLFGMMQMDPSAG